MSTIPELLAANRAANAIIAQQADEMAGLQRRRDSAIVIKPLVWTRRVCTGPNPDVTWDTAVSGYAYPLYRIAHLNAATALDGGRRYTLWPFGRDDVLGFPTLKAAQAAAQSEWDGFIRAAITTP